MNREDAIVEAQIAANRSGRPTYVYALYPYNGPVYGKWSFGSRWWVLGWNHHLRKDTIRINPDHGYDIGGEG